MVLGSCRESRHEDADRVWRWWIGSFCRASGSGDDPFLSLLSHHEGKLFTKAFLQCYRTTDWSTSGEIVRDRQSPVVASTVRQATSHVAAAFRSNLRDSPLHIPNGTHLRPFVRSLLRAFENADPPKRQQRAITPKLLRSMFTRAGGTDPLTKDTMFSILSDLAIMAYFFVMRS